MSIPVLVRSVGPEPSAGYYTQWTTFVPGYPKFKNTDTGISSALYSGEEIEANLISYRAHYLYYTGSGSEIVDRLVDVPLPLPGTGAYYDIPVTAYDPGSTGFSPDAGSSSGTAQPSGPARLDITVSESFALSTGNAKVTPWMSPRYVQEREIQANRWANLLGLANGTTPTSVILDDALSTQLVVQDFGFRVPEGATIEGIEVEIDRKVVGGATEKSLRVVGQASYSPSELVKARDAYSWKHSHLTSEYDSSYFASNGAVIVSGGTPASGQSPLLYRSADYGETWSSINPGLPTNSDIKGIAAAANGVWIATVYGYTDAYRVIRSTDNGVTWSTISTGAMSLVAFPSTIATNGAGVWVFGETQGRLIYSVDDGLTWSQAAFSFSESGGRSKWVTTVLYDGVKFIAFADTTSAGPDINEAQIANSPNGTSWTLRHQMPALVEAGGYPSIVNGAAVYLENPYPTPTNKVWVSVNNGDTWTQYNTPPGVGTGPGYTAFYDPVREKYLWSGAYSDSWSVVYESPDLPPTTFRIVSDVDDAFHGEWTQYQFHNAGVFLDRYGVRHEEVDVLVGLSGGLPASAIHNEGLSLPGGSFIYRANVFQYGGTEDDLRSSHKKTYGHSRKRGSDPAAEEGAQAWTAAEINSPSFGFGYRPEGTQGILEIGAVRARIHYRTDPTTDTIPAKRANGLAGVAESPSGVKVAVGVNGKILRKPANNPTWSAVSSGTTVSLNAVEWVGDRFIAVGMFGMALDGGADGSTWTRIATGAVTGLWAIKRVPESLRAIAVGNDDYAFERSSLGAWSV